MSMNLIKHSQRGRRHHITMCSRIGGQAASVPEDKSEEAIAGTHLHHLTASRPDLKVLKVVRRREHGNVIRNWRKNNNSIVYH